MDKRMLIIASTLLACCIGSLPGGVALGQDSLISQVKSDWVRLRSAVAICSGTVTGKSTATRTPQNFDFAIRNGLVKRLESEKDGDAVHVLWNDRGTFIVRQPVGEKWSLGGAFEPEAFEMRERSPTGYAFSAVSVLLQPLDTLLANSDYNIGCCELAPGQQGLVKLCVNYSPGMESFDWNTASNNRPPPVFDSVQLLLDDKHLCRIVSYDLRRTVQGSEGWIRAKYDYSNQADIHVPTTIQLDWGVVGSEKATRTDEVIISAELSAPDTHEFTLDYYGIDAPGGNRMPWYAMALVVAAGVLALVAFFRRR